ncbi:MAG: PAS domain S-box protein [Scytolyngbya sp. HA4215-MV1]|nr:PAS domain S-box protein [Scytolyngbya sp. HA4215-MV1]
MSRRLPLDSLCWEITPVEALSAALQEIQAYLPECHFDAVLSDLSLPDAFGLEAVTQIHRLAPDLPIVVLTGLDDEEVGLAAMRQGAQDYLVKGRIDYPLLSRAIRYAIERSHTQQVMRQQTTAMDACREGIAMLSEKGEYTYVNHAYAQVFGYKTTHELMGIHWHQLYSEAEIDRLTQIIQSEIQHQGDWYGEAIGKKRNGNSFYQELSLTALNTGGLICTVRDVTVRKCAEDALRNSEAQFRSYFDLPLVGIGITSMELKWLEVNETVCEMLGYSREELLQMTWTEVTFEDDLELDLACFNRLLSGEISQYAIDKRYVCKNGTIIHTHLGVGCVRNSDDQFAYAVAVIQDITERKRAEAEINRALARERELNHLKSSFVSMVSHEFRTPLTTIRMSFDLLQNYHQNLNEVKRAEYFKRVEEAIAKMLYLLDEILLLGKAEGGVLSYEPALMNLETFCQELVRTLQINAGNHHEIIFTTDGQLSTVEMDEVLLHHIFSNLLGNAVKYSPAGGQILFNLSYQSGMAVFKVKDGGIGIPEGDQEDLFATFHRASNVGKIQGSGLGLAIVKNCIMLHGGKIHLNSALGVGSTFIVRLPIQPEGRGIWKR